MNILDSYDDINIGMYLNLSENVCFYPIITETSVNLKGIYLQYG